DGGPAHSVGFVGDLVEHVGLAGVALGDFREEGLGPVQVVVGIARGEDVPVHDHVQAARRGHVDELVHPVGEAARVGLVAVFLDVHGQADDVGLPVVGQGVQRAVGQAVVEPLDAGGAHAAQLGRIAVLVAELGAADLDFAVPLDRGAGAGLRAGVGGGGSGTAGAARLGAFVAGGAVDGAVGGFAAAGSDEAEGGGASGRDGAVPGNPGEGVGVAAAGVLGVPHLGDCSAAGQGGDELPLGDGARGVVADGDGRGVAVVPRGFFGDCGGETGGLRDSGGEERDQQGEGRGHRDSDRRAALPG